MKAWKRSLAVKVAAVILFAVCLTAFGLSGLGILYAYEGGVYTENVSSFYKTGYISGFAYNLGVYDILHAYTAGVPLTDYEQNCAEGYSNYDYELSRIGEDGRPELLSGTIQDDRTYGYVNSWEYGIRDEATGEDQVYRIAVAIRDPMPLRSGDLYWYSVLFDTVYRLRTEMIVVLICALVLGIVDFVWLCCAAGHRKGAASEITPNWADRIPLDLYAAAAVLVIAVLLNVSIETGFWNLDLFANALGGLGLVAACMAALAVVLSFVTRVKLGAWWRNTVVWRVLAWLKRNGQRLLRLTLQAVRALPMIWRTLLATAALLVILLIIGMNCYWSGGAVFLYFLLSLAILAAVGWGVLQMRRLQKGGEALAAGNFDEKIDTGKLYWDLKRHAEHLNSIGDGMAIAVEQRMKSERLKTELITNVSHDIKTPLTSIINYVDLLQKAHTREEEAQYLEVLQRQSARLKKLTEDLVEASKASTGNISVNLVRTNVAESVSQALGEYQERLAAGSLQVVTSYPAEELAILADGRLLWRILDNLLNNVCKYAMAGTRVYVEASADGGTVRISVKNISRQQLNVGAEELMERFVRGDSARSTEGSGLGLNIARSLTELQKGRLQLVVDGDLFKAELIFPLA